jgi:hypothetical protein
MKAMTFLSKKTKKAAPNIKATSKIIIFIKGTTNLMLSGGKKSNNIVKNSSIFIGLH